MLPDKTVWSRDNSYQNQLCHLKKFSLFLQFWLQIIDLFFLYSTEVAQIIVLTKITYQKLLKPTTGEKGGKPFCFVSGIP